MMKRSQSLRHVDWFEVTDARKAKGDLDGAAHEKAARRIQQLRKK
jgi:flavin-binding protein dodecin